MNWLPRLQLVATVVAAGTLVATYALRSLWHWTPIFVAFAFWFWYARRLTWAAAPTVSATAFAMSAVVGVWSGIQMPYMLLVVTAALALWDLSGLEHRIGPLTGEAPAALVKAHLTKLGVTLIAGWLAVGVAWMVEFRLDFWSVFALSAFLVVSLSCTLRLLRTEPRQERDF